MFTMYVLRSKTTGRHYTGSTSDLISRLSEHNTDVSTSTKNRGPWELIHREDFHTLSEAVRRERYFKTGKGRDELQRILANSHPSSIG